MTTNYFLVLFVIYFPKFCIMINYENVSISVDVKVEVTAKGKVGEPYVVGCH